MIPYLSTGNGTLKGVVSGKRKTVEVVETVQSVKLVESFYHRGQKSEIRDQL